MAYKAASSEPIAIVASSCRFAGGATSPSKLWDLLKSPKDLTKPVPPERFNVNAFYHPEGDYHGTTDAPNSYYLEDEQDPRAFDAAFFGIAPKEAEAVDPQQRLLLESVYEAIESSGYVLGDWTGRDVAVFVGAMTADYDSMSQRDALSTSPYYATGNARSILANRISYFFDFHGPSATIDTACSSSLVALHQAVLSLRARECESACVAGVNLLLAPEQFVVESSLHMLSPTGHCHMWDTRADGYARGEGSAVLLLKPLSKALADGDASRIQGIIRETGVGSDGRTSGITMPSPQAQTSLIRSTYARAGLNLKNTRDWCQYFEAHGTGTPVGDPREAQAIHDAFYSMPHTQNLLVGSVKTVIGHTEGAAGLAGILKVMLAMKNGQVPPNLHMKTLSKTVAPFCYSKEQNGLEVVSSLRAWPPVPAGHPRRASVNSFGFGGTNAHAILEHFDPSIHAPSFVAAPSRVLPFTSLPPIPLLLSATSATSLRALAAKYLDYLQTHITVDMSDVAWRALSSRTLFLQRLSITGDGRAETMASLTKMLATTGELGVRALRVTSPLKMFGIFTGQGAQWAAMSMHLMRTSRIYRDTIQFLDSVLQACPHPPAWSIEGELSKVGDSNIGMAHISQPLCTAVQVGLVSLLRSVGLRFSAVVGHSSGEIGAAYAAGRISARDAILIAYFRGLAVSQSAVDGGMLACGLSMKQATGFCEQFGDRLCVAASNAPASTTLSGDSAAVDLAVDMLQADRIFARRLAVDRAYHSPQMNAFATTYLGYLEQCELCPLESGSETVWVSSVDPFETPTRDRLSGSYWMANMVRPVLFKEAIQTALLQLGSVDCAVEVGPHSALKGPFLETLKEAAVGAPIYTSMLRRGERDDLVLQSFFGLMSLSFDPSPINLKGLLGIDEKALVRASVEKMVRSEPLPSYPWDHSTIYYRQSRLMRQFHFRTDAPHELLGVRTLDDVDGSELRWRNLLRIEKLPWLAHHSFQGQPLLPASAYCVMAAEASKVLVAGMGKSAKMIQLEDVAFVGGIPLEVDGPATETMFSLMTLDETPKEIRARFAVYATPEASGQAMRMRCSGNVRICLGDASASVLPPRVPVEDETFAVDIPSFYDMMSDIGLAYTGPFRAIETMHRRNDAATASLKRLHADDTTKLSVSPATLDSCLQACFATYASPGDQALWTAFLPIKMAKVSFTMAPSQSDRLIVEAEMSDFCPAAGDTASRITGDILIYNEAGDMEIKVEGLTVGALAAGGPSSDRSMYLQTEYVADPEDTLLLMSDLSDDDSTLVSSESCDRVAEFVLGKRRAWPQETQESLTSHIQASAFASTLERLSKVPPSEITPSLIQSMAEEGRRSAQFRRQMTQLVRQIAHRYPRMAVLCLQDLSVSSESIAVPMLQGLASSFAHCTVVAQDDKELARYLETVPEISAKLSVSDKDVDLSGADLAIVSTSMFYSDGSTESALARARSALRPGAYLVLVHMPTTTDTRPMTPPAWPDVLDHSGFVRPSVNNTDQHYPGGFSITVRQTPSEFKETVHALISGTHNLAVDEHVLLVGTAHSDAVAAQLSGRATTVTVCPTVDGLANVELSPFTSVIFLADLDAATLSSLTDANLSSLRALLQRPGMAVLWVTQGARLGNAECAASHGFTRSIRAEMPGLTIQILDFDKAPCTSKIVSQFLQLILSKTLSKTKTESLWVDETEIFIDTFGTRLIPRVVPYKPANDNYNSARRVVANPVNTLSTPVAITFDGRASAFKTKLVDISADQDGGAVLDVLYSSPLPVVAGLTLVVGTNSGDEPVAALASTSASRVAVPMAQSVTLTGKAASLFAHSPGQFSVLLGKMLQCETLSHVLHDCEPIVLLGPDQLLAKCATATASAHQNTVVSVAVSTDATSAPVVVHPQATALQMRATLCKFRAGTVFVDYLASGQPLSAHARAAISRGCAYIPSADVAARPIANGASALLAQAISNSVLHFDGLVPLVLSEELSSPQSLLNSPRSCMVDWRADRIVLHAEQAIQHRLTNATALSPDRTYVLVGITRDLGQSLAGLLVSHGARNIVLASRTRILPENKPRWAVRLEQTRKVVVRFEALDVTSLDNVKAFKSTVEADMPPVGGIINGAMVLDDRIFTHMTADVFARVMRPKTVGSANLDSVFDGPLDFFIMTSSFAAPGGHAGQSNYAAANMYMNGLAADRMRRGLSGSVLNIGVIYGLGFLHREKGELYAALERDGYPPISERDLHHMFLEAIRCGRPGHAFVDLTTGLSRYDPSMPAEDMLHWHRDPRFSHFFHEAPKDVVEAAGSEASATKILADMVAQGTATSDELAQQLVLAAIERLSMLLHSDAAAESIRGDSSPAELGIDSLVAVETRTWLYRVTGHDVPVMRILGAPSINKLCADIASGIVAGRK